MSRTNNKYTLELELVPIQEGMEHDLPFILEDIKEFFENFGYKVVWNSVEDEEQRMKILSCYTDLDSFDRAEDAAYLNPRVVWVISYYRYGSSAPFIMEVYYR